MSRGDLKKIFETIIDHIRAQSDRPFGSIIEGTDIVVELDDITIIGTGYLMLHTEIVVDESGDYERIIKVHNNRFDLRAIGEAGESIPNNFDAKELINELTGLVL